MPYVLYRSSLQIHGVMFTMSATGDPSVTEVGMVYKVVNFYSFKKIERSLEETQEVLQSICENQNVLGTILLSPEGANFALAPDTVDETEQNSCFESLIDQIKERTEFKEFVPRYSTGSQKPFPRLKVRIQESVITFRGDQDPKVSAIKNGGRLLPEEWAAKIKDGSAVIVDTRNQYEWEWGKFKNADTFAIDKFSEFPEVFTKKYADQKDKTYLMYCTGGIRCEKAVAWANDLGFDQCYQLEGGILRFFDDLDQDSEKYYEGECFVFDRRWALDQNKEEVSAPSAANQGAIKQPKQYFEPQSQQGFDE